MFKRIAALAVVCAVVLAPSPADATILIKKDLRELCAESEVIVVGRVVAQKPAWQPGTGLIYTHTTISVESTIKGKPTTSIEVSEIGGTVGDTTLVVSGMPRFELDQTVLLALKRDALGLWRTHGLVQGRFRVTTNRATKERVVLLDKGLEHTTREFFPSARRTVAFDEFTEKVAELVAKAEHAKQQKEEGENR